jgi:diguanylate cyclase (GGDEF) domain
MINLLLEVLNEVNEGIVIIDEDHKISLWNKFMEESTGLHKGDVINSDLFTVLPNLNVNYFKRTLDHIFSHGAKMFFSAAMHSGIIENREYLNLKISRLESYNRGYLLLEFIDVTSQFMQINTLKSHVRELCDANKELKKKSRTIRKLAYYDHLTGVANRTLFYELAEKSLYHAERNNSILGLLFIDVNKFKSINDTYGHEAGDQVLVQVASILKKATRKNDVVARHGGDEFLILLQDIKTLKEHEIVVSRILNSKGSSVKYDEHEINISLSIGASFYPNDGNGIDQLIMAADRAMYVAKNMGGSSNFYYNSAN